MWKFQMGATLSICGESNRNVPLVSAIIKVYSNCTDNIIINTYEDFCNSNCDIIILIYDYLFYEIYLKKEDDIFKIIKNADSMDVIEIAVKTDKTDQRKEMAI